MLITNDDGNVLNDTFFNLASKSTNVTIASGYFGASQIEDAKPLFLEIAKKEQRPRKYANTIFSIKTALVKILK